LGANWEILLSVGERKIMNHFVVKKETQQKICATDKISNRSSTGWRRFRDLIANEIKE